MQNGSCHEVMQTSIAPNNTKQGCGLYELLWMTKQEVFLDWSAKGQSLLIVQMTFHRDFPVRCTVNHQTLEIQSPADPQIL